MACFRSFFTSCNRFNLYIPCVCLFLGSHSNIQSSIGTFSAGSSLARYCIYSFVLFLHPFSITFMSSSFRVLLIIYQFIPSLIFCNLLTLLFLYSLSISCVCSGLAESSSKIIFILCGIHSNIVLNFVDNFYVSFF